MVRKVNVLGASCRREKGKLYLQAESQLLGRTGTLLLRVRKPHHLERKGSYPEFNTPGWMDTLLVELWEDRLQAEIP